jgi:hypothetical protein
MRSCLAGLSVALVSEPFWFGTLPAFAKPTEFQDNSFDTDLDGDASALMADGKRAQQTRLRMPCMTAVPRFLAAVPPFLAPALAEAETDGGKHPQEFRAALNERKARLGMIGAELTTPTDQDDAAELTPTDQD